MVSFCLLFYLFWWSILQVSNLLYVDQPTGTGFSYTTDKRDIRHDEAGVSNDLYDFLQVLKLYLKTFVKISCIFIIDKYKS